MSASDLPPYTFPSLSERVDAVTRARIQARIDSRIKPLGALGQLEPLAALLVALLGESPTLTLSPILLLCAGDHGVAAKGVSIATSDVTAQMVEQMLAGRAAVNIFAQQSGVPISVVNCGLARPMPDQAGLVSLPLGNGTAAIDEAPAMTLAQVHQALANGRQLVKDRIAVGHNVFAVGEIGIGNTTAASALMAALTGLPAEACVGMGTGISETQHARKVALVERALAHHDLADDSPLNALAALGGFEIATLVGVILAAAEAGYPVVIDGFVTSVAALVAIRYRPHCRDYLIFSQMTAEKGHAALYKVLKGAPLMSMDLRIGEGAGAILALPLLTAALRFYHDMGGFEEGLVHV